MKKITVGVIASLRDTSEMLRVQIPQTGIATLVVQIEESSSITDRASRQLIEADPEVIIVEIRDPAAALKTLQVLQTALPKARLLVTSHSSDSHVIMEAMRSGAREFLPSPVSPATLLQAFNRHVAEKERTMNHSRAQRGKLYCVTSPKHGSGATTLAINLAGILAARTKQRLALIDLDRPVGDAAAYLNVKPTFTVSDALSAGSRLDSVLLESYMQTTNGFHLLAGSREYVSDTAMPIEQFSQLLDVAQESFDHTIVDLPPTLDEAHVQVIARNSETILVVLTPELPTIWRAERLLSYLTRLDAADKARVILNRTTRSDEIGDRDIEKLLGRAISCRLPNEYTVCIKAINSGRLLDATHSKHLFRAIYNLASEMAGLPEAEGRRGLLGMFMKPASGGMINA